MTSRWVCLLAAAFLLGSCIGKGTPSSTKSTVQSPVSTPAPTDPLVKQGAETAAAQLVGAVPGGPTGGLVNPTQSAPQDSSGKSGDSTAFWAGDDPESAGLREFPLMPGELTTSDLERWDDQRAAQAFLELVKTGTAADVRAAIDSGAKVNYGDWYKGMQSSGFTPLMLAAGANPSAEVVEALIDAGAKVNVYDKYLGWDALIYAAELNPNGKVIRTLLDHGARIGVRLNSGDTALMCAADANPNVDVIRILIEYGARINDANVQGMTPLMLAAYHNPNEAIVLELLRAGADKTVISKEGRKAIDYARESHPSGDFSGAIKALQ